MRTEVSKGEFARMKGRTPQCVSNWIADGKITPAAIVGEGYRAKIWVERADADLARTLDPAQQASQESPVMGALLPRAEAPPPPAPAPMALPRDEPAPLSLPLLRAAAANDDEDLRRRRRADADKAEFDAEAARRKLAIDEGRWIDAAAAQREWAAALAKEISGFETFLTGTLARQLADEHHLDWKVIATQMRDAFRAYREDVSNAAQSGPGEEAPEAAE